MACLSKGQRPGVARHPSNFLSLARQESHQRKGDPAVCDPFAALRGNLGCSVTGCAAELAARLQRSVQTTAVSQFTKHVCPSTHMPPRALRAPGASRREPANRTSTRAIASLRCARPCLAGASATRCANWAERSDGPYGCSAVGCLAPNPCWLRLRRGGCGVSMGVEAPMLRALTRRGCPSGARQRKASSTAHPATAPLQVCPFAQRRGRLSFGYFSLAKQRKVPRPPGRLPAPALNTSMQQPPPKRRQAQPEHIGQEPTIKTIAASALCTSTSSQ